MEELGGLSILEPPKFDDLMIPRIEPGGQKAWSLALWMAILQPAAWRLGGADSLNAGGNDDESGHEDADE